MAKRKTDPIGQADLTDFLDNHSDFSFELQVLNTLVGFGFTCEHGGSYEDPVTGKPRQFDIRARKDFDKRILRFAVECKNINEDYPLFVSCVLRRDEEAFHEVVLSVDPRTTPLQEPARPFILAMEPRCKAVRVRDAQSLYRSGVPVGKSCEQVRRTEKGDIATSDSDVFAKWSQALSSAHDLTYEACGDGSERTGGACLSLVFPLLVVPNERLWVVEFDAAGKRTCAPQQTDRCSYYVNQSYYHKSASGGDEMTISHLEFLTVAGLCQFVDQLCGNEGRMRQSFSIDSLVGSANIA
jgi:hypothetical protein